MTDSWLISLLPEDVDDDRVRDRNDKGSKARVNLSLVPAPCLAVRGAPSGLLCATAAHERPPLGPGSATAGFRREKRPSEPPATVFARSWTSCDGARSRRLRAWACAGPCSWKTITSRFAKRPPASRQRPQAMHVGTLRRSFSCSSPDIPDVTRLMSSAFFFTSFGHGRKRQGMPGTRYGFASG